MSSKIESMNRIKKPDRNILANAIRVLSMDAVQKANSGHPGMPMGMADIAEVLWNDFLKHNPNNPEWIDRDRFVLSNGHGSMLLYSLLHLSGYKLSIEEIQNFRQFGHHTAGHPEREPHLSIETTTGPLGQGISNAVGFALGEKVLAQTFNKDKLNIVDHRTWVFLGDGCLMEGISHEACSLAGTLKLGKLICFYDDNGISIDGETKGWFTDDNRKRFESYGWHVIDDVDGHDSNSISTAIESALLETERPSLICCKTIIGFGSPNKQGTASSHGAPLGEDEINKVRSSLNWSHGPFVIPEDIRNAWNGIEKGELAQASWQRKWEEYKEVYPDLADEFTRRIKGELPHNWKDFSDEAIRSINESEAHIATRKASLVALNNFSAILPELIGGSADLTGSNLTKHDQSIPITGNNALGNYIYFGVREFGMTAICNGLSLHGGFLPYSGTFLVFSDYSRNALRMAALMEAQNISVFTHDSIGLGEDGPTHQPVEHVSSLRLMPNMRVWRPCDTVETAVAWRDAIENKSGPTSLILTRQGLPHQDRNKQQIKKIVKGGYILKDSGGIPDLIFIATGSEIGLAVEAAETLISEGLKIRVVSMPCTELFELQDPAYREEVLPEEVTARLAVEAGVTNFWWKYVGSKGHVIGLDRFGASAPAEELFDHFGFSYKNVLEHARKLLAL